MPPEITPAQTQEDTLRSRDELAHAHDVLRSALISWDVCNTLLDDYEDMAWAVNCADVLCWALHHYDNPAFGQNIISLEESMRAMDVEIRDMPERPGWEIPPIERLGNLLAEARRENAALRKIIEERENAANTARGDSPTAESSCST
jgi:hypothetical protein